MINYYQRRGSGSGDGKIGNVESNRNARPVVYGAEAVRIFLNFYGRPMERIVPMARSLRSEKWAWYTSRQKM